MTGENVIRYNHSDQITAACLNEFYFIFVDNSKNIFVTEIVSDQNDAQSARLEELHRNKIARKLKQKVTDIVLESIDFYAGILLIDENSNVYDYNAYGGTVMSSITTAKSKDASKFSTMTKDVQKLY